MPGCWDAVPRDYDLVHEKSNIGPKDQRYANVPEHSRESLLSRMLSRISTLVPTGMRINATWFAGSPVSASRIAEISTYPKTP